MFVLRISNHIVRCNPGSVLIADVNVYRGFPGLFLVTEEEKMNLSHKRVALYYRHFD